MSHTQPHESSERDRRLDEVVAAILAAEDAGQAPLRELLLAQNADLADELKAFLGAYDRVRVLAAPLRAVAAVRSHDNATTDRDPESALAVSTGPVGRAFETTEIATATVQSTAAPDEDVIAAPRTTPNGKDQCDPIEYGTRVRYFGDYELLSVLGRGGMGVVYKARQVSLNRPVALKMLQAGVLATEDDLRRFQNEAEAVAMLDHPHIVPILEVGQYADQRYFSMKLIAGRSLDRKLSDFINDPKAAARLVRTAAEAVHHAHVRGILHRDLKPANVLLDERGEPHLTDFGLAKRVHGDSDLTRTGVILGTPPYMAPEQTSRKRGMVTTATDVYGLGAILYALLTGRAPFAGDSALDTLEQVRERAPDPPSKHTRRVPRDLEVICLKCLEKQPERRYASAQALAEDLQRYLNSEAILARPVGLATRAWMWCTRNPALARLWFALILTLLLFLATWGGIAIVIIVGVSQREKIARAEAGTNFDLAQKAVEDYLTNVSENTLLKEQDSLEIRRLRHDLLNSALEYYQQFAAQRKDDPRVRQQLAGAYFRVGQITGEIGSKAQALGAFRSAVAIWEPLVEANPKAHELSGNLAETYLAIGKLESIDGDVPAALDQFERARPILERLSEANPAEPRYRANLADCYSEIGIALAKQKKHDESLAFHEKARAIQEALIHRYPGNLAYRKGLAENLNAIGFAQYTRKDKDEALKTFHKVKEICQALLQEVSEGSKPAWLLNLLALSEQNIGIIHKEKKELEKALPFFEEALKYRSDLVDLHPSVTRFRVKLGVSYREIAELEHEAHRNSKAIASIQRAIDIFTDVVRSHPETAVFHSDLGLSWHHLGVFLDEARNNAEALRAFQRAVVEQQTAIGKTDSPDQYKPNLANHLENLGEQYLDLGLHPDTGLPFYEQAIEIRRELCRAHPENRQYALDLVKALSALGTIQRHLGNDPAARQSFADARKALEQPIQSAPGDSALQVQLAAALAGEAAAYADLAQPEKARGLLEDAATRFRRLPDREAPASELAPQRQKQSETLWDLARVLRDLKQPQEAERALAERIELWKKRPPEELLDLAIKHLTEATMIGYGKTPVSGPAAAVRELDLKQAAADVKLAIAHGLKDLSKLKTHPDSGALFERKDLAPVLDDIVPPR